MAQTRRKRQTKHRGNAAGFVESRGRTGRKPTAAEKSGKAAEAARAKAKRVDPRDRPPTWRGAMVSALDVRSFTVGPVQENCYVVSASDAAPGEGGLRPAVIVDPGEEPERLLE